MKKIFNVFFPSMFAVTFFLLWWAAKPQEQPKKECVSSEALLGCEEMAFGIEKQLRQCEQLYIYCHDKNEKLMNKEKNEDADN